MISKTIGFRGTQHFQTHPFGHQSTIPAQHLGQLAAPVRCALDPGWTSAMLWWREMRRSALFFTTAPAVATFTVETFRNQLGGVKKHAIGVSWCLVLLVASITVILQIQIWTWILWFVTFQTEKTCRFWILSPLPAQCTIPAFLRCPTCTRMAQPWNF